MLRPERVRKLDEGVEYRLTLSQELQSKIAEVKVKLSHVNPTASLAEIFERLCDEFLRRRENGRSMSKEEPDQEARVQKAFVAFVAGRPRLMNDRGQSNEKRPQRKLPLSIKSDFRVGEKSAPARKYLSPSVRRIVMQRSGSRCEKCGSNWQMEIDHRYPVGLGGTDQLDNLRTLCRNCNQRAAVESFGKLKIQPFAERRLDSVRFSYGLRFFGELKCLKIWRENRWLMKKFKSKQ